MKKLFFILLFLGLYFVVEAQERFSRYYANKIKTNDLAGKITYIPHTGYAVSALSVDPFHTDTFNYIRTYHYYFMLDLQGDTLWSRSHWKPYHNVELSKIEELNGFLYMAGDITNLIRYKEDSIGSDVYIVKSNLQGDTLWSKTISLGPGDEYVLDMIKTSDGGIAMNGQVCTQMGAGSVNCDYYLLKIDSSGSVQINKRYSWNATSFEYGYALTETSDKGFLLFGTSDPSGSDIRSMYLVKTDSFGNMQWQKEYRDIQLSRTGLDIIDLKNGDYFLIGITRKEFPIKHNGLIIKINQQGDIIWIKEYGGSAYDNFDRGIYLGSNEVVLAGNTQSYNIREDTDGWLMKLDTSGAIIWERVFDTWREGDTGSATDHIYNISEAEEGYILVGFGDNPDKAGHDQDVWVLKVDSMGCLQADCHLTGIVQVHKASGIRLYPNPAKEYLYIHSPETIVRYALYTMLGERVAEGLYETNIPVSELNPGMYVLKLQLRSGEEVMLKVMKE